MKFPTRLCLTLALAGASLANVANAQTTPPAAFAWDRVNVAGGGMNTGILVHPAVPDLIYARQDVSGLLRWNPAAKKWEQLFDWMPAAWKNAKSCSGFAVDTTAGADKRRQDTIYAAVGSYHHPTQMNAAGNGVFRSFDRGATWTKIWDGSIVKRGDTQAFSFAGNGKARRAGENMALDPLNPDILWVGTNTDGLWVSRDARAAKPTFTKVENAPLGFHLDPYASNGIRCVLIDPRVGSLGEGNNRRAKLIYLGLTKGTPAKNPPAGTAADPVETGVFRSSDGGETWEHLTGENAPTSARRMAFGPQPGHVIVAGDPGLRHFDGAGWSTVAGTEKTGSEGLAGSADGMTLVAQGGKEAVMFSRDGGKSWRKFTLKQNLELKRANWVVPDFANPSTAVYALDPHHPDRVLFGDSFGVHALDGLNTDKLTGEPWLIGYETTVGWALCSPPVGPRLYYTTADVNGFLWEGDTFGITPQDQLYQRAYPDDKGGVGAQANWGIGDSVCSDVKFAPSAPERQVVLRSTWKGYTSPYARIYRSADAGKTWTGFDAPPPNVPNAPSSMKAGGAAKVIISATDPNRWVYVRPGGYPVYTENGFSGAPIEWKPSTGVDKAFMDIFPYYVSALRLAADAVEGKRFYYGNRNGGNGLIYVSNDGGATWETGGKLPKVGDEFHLATVRGPAGQGQLWVATGPGGLRMSKDGGREFTEPTGGAVTLAKGLCFGPPRPGSDANKAPALYLAGTVRGRDGVFLSEDFGKNWTPMTSADRPLVGGLLVSDMVADPRQWGRVFIATSGTGILYSTATP